MPVVSRFYGIVIYFFFKEHNPPHFHAEYNKHQAVILIDSLELEEGSLPGKALALVLEWAKEHQVELMKNWDLAREGKQPNKIEPLK